jgi:hypothetical protein
VRTSHKPALIASEQARYRVMNKKDEYNNTCDRCGKTEAGIGWFARAYRLSRIRKGKPDPGNVCGACAGGETGKEIGSRIIEKEKLT